MLQKFWIALKQNFWPISALLFCPCHLPLSMAGMASLTAGTALGAFIATNYSSIETVLAVAFSFYFVLAFMIWVVRGPQPVKGAACVINNKGEARPTGLSTRQIIVWGVIGMLMMPALVSISLFTKQNILDDGVVQLLVANVDVNSGLIWLVSLATVVMIPVMVIWLVWMWLAWSKTDSKRVDQENWSYEYE
jgi:hypothetical protein